MKKLNLILFASLLLFAGCKKGKQKLSQSCQLINSTFSGGNSTSEKSFSYDEEGRLVKVAYNDDSMYNESYSYLLNTIIKVEREGNKVFDTHTYRLDAQGRIISDTSERGFPTLNYSYDNNGYLTESTIIGSSNYKETIKYSFTGGNLTKVSSPTSTFEMTYSTIEAKTNYLPFIDENQNYLIHFGNLKSFYGKQSKNLVIGESQGTYLTSYIYEKDSADNISKISVKVDQSIWYTISNAYTCK